MLLSSSWTFQSHHCKGVSYRSELEKLWPHWSFEGVKEEVWWLDHTPEKDNPKRVITEPEGEVLAFRQLECTMTHDD